MRARGTAGRRDDPAGAIPTPNKTVTPPDKTVPTPNKTVPTPNKTVTPPDKTVPTRNKTVPTHNKTIPTRDKTVTTRDKTVTTRNKTVPTRDKTVTTCNKTITTCNKTVPTPNKTIPAPDKTVTIRFEAIARGKKGSPRRTARIGRSDRGAGGQEEVFRHRYRIMTERSAAFASSLGPLEFAQVQAGRPPRAYDLRVSSFRIRPTAAVRGNAHEQALGSGPYY